MTRAKVSRACDVAPRPRKAGHESSAHRVRDVDDMTMGITAVRTFGMQWPPALHQRR